VAESFGSAGTRALARSALSVVLEVAAADTYAALSCCSYYSARNTLAHLPLLNEFSQNNALVVALAEDLNKGRPPERRITDCVFLLSRLVDEYKNLDELVECLPRDCRPDVGGEAGGAAGGGGAQALLVVVQPFMACVEAGFAPQHARVEGVVVPILGLMEVLAAARLLGDTDVLGGSGKNAGFVIERDAGSRRPVAVRVVKVGGWGVRLQNNWVGAGRGRLLRCGSAPPARALVVVVWCAWSRRHTACTTVGTALAATPCVLRSLRSAAVVLGSRRRWWWWWW
jgi:hypothetical protein